MSAHTWPEIKRRLIELRYEVANARMFCLRDGLLSTAELRQREYLAALDAVLSIEAADPDQFLPNVPS